MTRVGLEGDERTRAFTLTAINQKNEPSLKRLHGDHPRGDMRLQFGAGAHRDQDDTQIRVLSSVWERRPLGTSGGKRSISSGRWNCARTPFVVMSWDCSFLWLRHVMDDRRAAQSYPLTAVPIQVTDAEGDGRRHHSRRAPVADRT